MKFYKQKTEIQQAITLKFFKKLLSDTNNFFQSDKYFFCYIFFHPIVSLFDYFTFFLRNNYNFPHFCVFFLSRGA